MLTAHCFCAYVPQGGHLSDAGGVKRDACLSIEVLPPSIPPKGERGRGWGGGVAEERALAFWFVLGNAKMNRMKSI
jgi:hypothetical protein